MKQLAKWYRFDSPDARTLVHANRCRQLREEAGESLELCFKKQNPTPYNAESGSKSARVSITDVTVSALVPLLLPCWEKHFPPCIAVSANLAIQDGFGSQGRYRPSAEAR